MKITKTKTGAARKKQRNTKRTGSGKAKSAPPRKTSRTKTEGGPARANSKLATIIKLLSRDHGATLSQMALGRHADDQLSGAALSGQEVRLDRAMEGLYGRAQSGRGYRPRQGGSLDPSKIVLPQWIDELKQLFPASVFETIQGHAIERMGMAELLADPEALKRLEPNLGLMKVLLSFRGRADPKIATASAVPGAKRAPSWALSG